jgi:hypothetical protein
MEVVSEESWRCDYYFTGCEKWEHFYSVTEGLADLIVIKEPDQAMDFFMV